MKQKYTINDLTVRHHQTTEDDHMAYTHKAYYDIPNDRTRCWDLK